MNRSETIGKLAEALSKAQAEMEGAKKGATNPHFNRKYADLASVWDACRGPLTANNLAVAQLMQKAEDTNSVCVVTTLIHSSGEWISGELNVPVAKRDPQGFGSAITYARRYTLMAMVGIAPEDDDGNAASQPVLTQAGPSKPHLVKPPVDNKKSTVDVGALYKRITECRNFEDLAKVSKAISDVKINMSTEDLKRLQEAWMDMKANFEASEKPSGK